FLAGLPQELLLLDDRQRGLLRYAMRRMLPDRLRLRPDKARVEPAIVDLAHGENLALLRDLAGMRLLGELGLVDPRLYRRHFDAVLADGGKKHRSLGAWVVH